MRLHNSVSNIIIITLIALSHCFPRLSHIICQIIASPLSTGVSRVNALLFDIAMNHVGEAYYQKLDSLGHTFRPASRSYVRSCRTVCKTLK